MAKQDIFGYDVMWRGEGGSELNVTMTFSFPEIVWRCPPTMARWVASLVCVADIMEGLFFSFFFCIGVVFILVCLFSIIPKRATMKLCTGRHFKPAQSLLYGVATILRDYVTSVKSLLYVFI